MKGTLMNVFLIGISLSLFVESPIDWLNFPKVPFVEMMTFSTAISAVDPVCVSNQSIECLIQYSIIL